MENEEEEGNDLMDLQQFISWPQSVRPEDTTFNPILADKTEKLEKKLQMIKNCIQTDPFFLK